MVADDNGNSNDIKGALISDAYSGQVSSDPTNLHSLIICVRLFQLYLIFFLKFYNFIFSKISVNAFSTFREKKQNLNIMTRFC